MYDLDDDDSITRGELLAVLHMMVGSNIPEDQVLSFCHIMLKCELWTLTDFVCYCC